MVRGFPGPVPSRAVPIDIDIAKVARLARMGLDDAELRRIGAQLGDILEHAARIQALDLEHVPPTAHPLPMVNAFRPDEVGPTLDREEVLDQAPERDGPFFRVPPFMDEA
jgi:aspartyl-tRNA(Asn)/glutamyl-tRNA(Gln) amidotransferase subunit C